MDKKIVAPLSFETYTAMKKVLSFTITATARVYNSEQGKDYEEDVEVTFIKNEPDGTWFVNDINIKESI